MSDKQNGKQTKHIQHQQMLLITTCCARNTVYITSA